MVEDPKERVIKSPPEKVGGQGIGLDSLSHLLGLPALVGEERRRKVGWPTGCQEVVWQAGHREVGQASHFSGKVATVPILGRDKAAWRSWLCPPQEEEAAGREKRHCFILFLCMFAWKKALLSSLGS